MTVLYTPTFVTSLIAVHCKIASLDLCVCDTWDMKLNMARFNHLRFTRKRRPVLFTYSITGNSLSTVRNVKYIGAFAASLNRVATVRLRLETCESGDAALRRLLPAHVQKHGYRRRKHVCGRAEPSSTNACSFCVFFFVLSSYQRLYCISSHAWKFSKDITIKWEVFAAYSVLRTEEMLGPTPSLGQNVVA